MTNKQKLHSEDTKKGILSAAGTLFAKRGYDAVTMREIAKKANCSHTTIYIYFSDKEALLHELSMPPLQQLRQDMQHILQQNKPPEHKLKELCREFIRFCLLNRAMHTIFFTVKSSRIDEEPALELNKLRIALFELLKRSLQECLQLEHDDDRLLSFSRIFFYTLHGIVGTYTHSAELTEPLLERLSSTIDDALEVLLIGFQYKLERS